MENADNTSKRKLTRPLLWFFTDPIETAAPQRFVVFSTMALLGVVVLAGFGVYNFIQGEYFTSVLGIAASAISATGYIVARRSQRRGIIYFIFLLLISQFLLYLFSIGGESGSLSLWMFLVPIMSFFLLGHRLGLAVIVVSILGVTAVAIGLYPYFYHYTTEFFIRFLIAYVLLCSFGYVYESVRVRLATEAARREEKLQALNQRITVLSITDSLTGCYNRLYFDEKLPSEIKRAQRYSHPLSIIIADIDHFKKINDLYGHHAGDETLSRVGECLLCNVREDIDWVSRCGGEEFAAVLPNTGIEGAQEVAERLRKAIENLRIDVDGKKLRITISVGVSEVSAHEETASTLFQRADKLLYRAKESGRNRVCAP